MLPTETDLDLAALDALARRAATLRRDLGYEGNDTVRYTPLRPLTYAEVCTVFESITAVPALVAEVRRLRARVAVGYHEAAD